MAMRNKFKVTIDGVPLMAELEHKMLMAMVEDSRNAPDLFVLSFLDPDRKGPNSMLEKTRAQIGSTAEIKVVSGDETSGEPLFKGEITAIETEFDADGTQTIIRGFDKSHRLFRGNKTRAWTNKSYSDIASEIAKDAKLTVDPAKIDATTPVFDHVPQFNMSDWDFLRWMAAESNREMAVGDGKFEFRKATAATTAPPVAKLGGNAKPKQLKLSDLRRFHAIVTAADQVKEVNVKGWDYVSKESILGNAKAGTTSAKVGTSPGEIADKFGNPVYTEVSSPSGNQKHLEGVAQSIAEQIGAGHAEIEFEAFGNHELRAGTPISFAGAGKLFDGQGIITSTRHIFERNQGYRTFGYITGRQDRSLFALTSGSNGNGSNAGTLGARRIEGVVPATVENNDDPKGFGRVKLKFPWLDDKYVSDWARVIQAGAGKDGGWLLLPEVGDEVMVAFEQGDVRYPIVIGGVYSEKTPLHAGKIKLLDSSTKNVNKRGFISRIGHRLSFIESKDQKGISLTTADKKHQIALNQTKNGIGIESSGGVFIKGDAIDLVCQNLKLSASGSIEVEAAAQLTLKGKTVNIN